MKTEEFLETFRRVDFPILHRVDKDNPKEAFVGRMLMSVPTDRGLVLMLDMPSAEAIIPIDVSEITEIKALDVEYTPGMDMTPFFPELKELDGDDS